MNGNRRKTPSLNFVTILFHQKTGAAAEQSVVGTVADKWAYQKQFNTNGNMQKQTGHLLESESLIMQYKSCCNCVRVLLWLHGIG